MSFLDNEDEMLTLEAALEFIETCGDSDERSSASPEPSTGASSDDERLGQLRRAAPADPPKRKPSASTQQQRRRKQEIQTLKEQVGELEAHLVQLKRRHAVRLGDSGEIDADDGNGQAVVRPEPPTELESRLAKKQRTSSVWMDLAVIQYRERQRSEITNRKLKAIWVNQAKLNEAVQHILQKRSTFAGRDLVFNQPALYEAPSAAYVGVNVMIELEKSMQNLYLESESVFRPVEDSVSISCFTETNYQPGVGSFVDLRTTTPVNCTVEETSGLIWREANSRRKYPDKSYEIKPGADDNSAEKNFVWTLRDVDSKVALNGLQYVRKFDEPNRVVIVRNTLLLLPTSGVKFRDRTWMVISPDPNDPVHKSIVRTCYRVFVEPESRGNFKPADIEHLREFVTTTLIGGMRMFAQTVQNALLEESTRLARVRAVQELGRAIRIR